MEIGNTIRMGIVSGTYFIINIIKTSSYIMKPLIN